MLLATQPSAQPNIEENKKMEKTKKTRHTISVMMETASSSSTTKRNISGRPTRPTSKNNTPALQTLASLL